MKYENRVVAFIDILGFKSLLDETTEKDGSDNEKNIDALISAYKTIKDVWEAGEGFDSLSKPTSRKVSIFSDSIVVSFEVGEKSQVFSTLLDIKHLIMRLVYRKILCRGAVAIGKFIHTDDFLFGPALVEAYTLESKAAMYPRIILDRDIIEAASIKKPSRHTADDEERYVESLLEQDSDGMYYIDYFFKARTELDDPEYDFPEYIEILGEIIRKGLMGSSHHGKADLRIKYSWMRERYNRMVEIVTDKKAVATLNSSGLHDVYEFYVNLKKISPNKDNKVLHRISR
tara:strand:- start:2 stop:862 length:861 start_codon:yes stop_codon:yes gene_type:complete